MTRPPRIVGLAAVAALAVLTACSDPTPPGGPAPSSESPQASASSPAPSTSSEPTSAPSTPPPRNDLAKNEVQRALSAAPLTANVEYSTTLPVKEWRPQVVKPLRITMTAINNRSKGQKIYLTRLTASVTAYDATGVVDGPRAITDSANLNPGYYVTFPTEYGQTLLLPAVDDGAIRLTIDFTYEFVAQVSGGDKTSTQRDFAKQTATDRLSVPLS